MPVVVALSKAYADGNPVQWVPAGLCFVFALLMQVDANFVNDYFDCVRGLDDGDRLGPPRACAQGWVTLRAMRVAMGLVTAAACLAGLPLVLWGGMTMVWVGVACVVCCFLYTTLLAQRALGDVLVVVFFGLVPVCATYYLQAGTVLPGVAVLALGCGLVTDCLLVVNNYRDRDTDRSKGKRTLVTVIGARASEWLYLALGVAGCLCTASCVDGFWGGVMAVWAAMLAAGPWRLMRRIGRGRELNRVLGLTSLFILAYGVLTSLAVVLGARGFLPWAGSAFILTYIL